MKVVSFVIGAAFKWLERSFCKTMEREEIFQMASFGVNQATEMGVVKKPTFGHIFPGHYYSIICK